MWEQLLHTQDVEWRNIWSFQESDDTTSNFGAEDSNECRFYYNLWTMQTDIIEHASS